MDRPALLLLTDLSNGDADEDIAISDFLRAHFRVLVSHPMDCDVLEDSVDAIIVRNVWNAARYGEPEPWYDRWRAKNRLPIHDDLYQRNGCAKDYLLELYAQGYPVIPTVDSIRDLAKLPAASSYFIKPKNGFDAINARRISESELCSFSPGGYLVQPFVDFEHECSFYYLDGILRYALFAPEKTQRWDMMEFRPSKEDVAFAESFVSWGLQKRGIVRIDACRLTNGSLLLLEISDQGGVYLSLSCLSDRSRGMFLNELKSSIARLARRHRMSPSTVRLPPPSCLKDDVIDETDIFLS